MDKKNKKKKLLPFMLMFVASIAIGVTGATVLHKLKLENPIKTPTVEGKVDEDPEPKKNGKAAKKVQFCNVGEADVLIRAAISESWTYKENGNKTILPNKAISKNNSSDLLTVAQPLGYIATSGAPISRVEPSKPNAGKWIYNPKDGWYYYTRVLPGSSSNKTEQERQTEFLVTDVDFTNIENVADERYKAPGAEYELHVTMEIVQASDVVSLSQEAAEKLFDIKPNIPKKWNNNKFSCDIAWPVPTS